MGLTGLARDAAPLRNSKKPANEISRQGLESRAVATLILTRIIDDKRNLDALTDHAHGLERYLKLEPRDRAFARAMVVTALRHRMGIEATINHLAKRPLPKRARLLHHALHIAAAQILFMDSADRAAADLCVTQIGRDTRTERFKSLTNALLRRMTGERAKLIERIANVSSTPTWFSKMLRTDYGKTKAREINDQILVPPALDLTIKSNAAQWAQRLEGAHLPTDTVRLLANTPVHELEGYNAGAWWVQDAAASIPARLLKPHKNAQVLELCAAPGGKTAQLANAGYHVTAVDRSRPRLERLLQNLNRLNLTAETVEADILEWEPEEAYPFILLDAPCSSTGTARRHPDVVWTKSPEEIAALAKLQKDLLAKAWQFLQPGGTLVFSNCSIFKREGEDLLADALHALPGVKLDPIGAHEITGLEGAINGQGALRILPNMLPDPDNPRLGGLDGFFACRLQKHD